MNRNDIRQMLEVLPEGLLDDVSRTQHFFYGENEGLDCVKDEVIKNNKEAIFIHENESLVLELDTSMNEETLLEAVKAFQDIASSYKVEYDGFEIMLDDHEIDQPKFLPFETFFEPASYVKRQLPNNKYAYLLFLGGNTLNGYFFECLSLTDDGNASVAVLDDTARVFRQPIQGTFDPQACSYVGVSKKNPLPTKFSYRLLEGADTPEEIDELYKRYNISESEPNSWLRILDKISKSGSHELFCKSTMKYDVVINENGQPKWSNMLPLSIDNNIPMPFGTFLNKDKLNAIFIDNINELALIDTVYGRPVENIAAVKN